MVLWEITLGTAYFLGLKRTYRLALRIQRRLVGPNHPKIREFLHRRTRVAFDLALKVHRNVQQRDIEVGRNLGNWILRWLDRMKPSAEIRPRDSFVKSPATCNTAKHLTNTGQHPGTQRNNQKITDQDSRGRLLASAMNIRPKSFPTLGMMMRPARPAGMNGQYRHIYSAPIMPNSGYKSGEFGGVYRKDIMQWMLQN